MGAVVKKLFKHGGSYAVDLPISFIRKADVQMVVVENKGGDILIHPKTSLDTIESEPAFAHFIRALAEDALNHPDKLKTAHEVWDPEWDNLLRGVSCE
jgi:hypothetical protein